MKLRSFKMHVWISNVQIMLPFGHDVLFHLAVASPCD